MSLLVMKFGGTSLGTPTAMQKAAEIVQSQAKQQKLVVVVSALAGITNQLVESAHSAPADRELVGVFTRKFLDRHLQHLADLSLFEPFYRKARKAVDNNAILLYNILFSAYQSGSAYPALVDETLALGELTCAAIFTQYLCSQGISAGELDARKLIVTDSHYTNASVEFAETNQTILQWIPTLLQDHSTVVVPGFVGKSIDGRTTTLGRGASDYTASILAAALNADEVWNWTDVDGVYTADPRTQPEAKLIPTLSYDDMASLSKRGAKVLHPEAVAPLVQQKIPLRVRNTFHPERTGSLIHHPDEKAISDLDQIRLSVSTIPANA